MMYKLAHKLIETHFGLQDDDENVTFTSTRNKMFLLQS